MRRLNTKTTNKKKNNKVTNIKCCKQGTGYEALNKARKIFLII